MKILTQEQEEILYELCELARQVPTGVEIVYKGKKFMLKKQIGEL